RRLKRDLGGEIDVSGRLATQLGFQDYSPGASDYEWIADTDQDALQLLARLATLGEESPRTLWPEGKTLRMVGEITPSALRVRVSEDNDWFDLTGSLEIDGRAVDLAELLAAVREGRGYVKIGEKEFARISDAFRRRLQQLGDAVMPQSGGLRVADAAVPVVQDLLGEDIAVEASQQWVENLARLESIRTMAPEIPGNLDATLRDYQVDGYQWLSRLATWGVGGVLADDMGLGKTVQALGVLLTRSQEGPALVVAPTSVGDNWCRETKRFAPSLTPLLYRDHDRQSLIEKAGPGDLIIVSYQLLQRDYKRFASRVWHTMVLDEAQFIKNAQTKTAQAIRSIEATWRLGLSGTPLENHLGELWSLFRALSPGLLGSWDRFRTRFADPIERQRDEERRVSLSKIVQPFILRRTKNTVLSELPPRTEVTLTAELSTRERTKYEEARLAAVAELNGLGQNDPKKAGEHRMRTLAWLTRLRQLACHPRLVDSQWGESSAKLDLLLETVRELRENDHRALVFSQFVKHLTVVREALDAAGVTYQYLDGSTPAKERQRRVDAFQEGEGDLFLISLKAGGTGLNLTAADYVLHLDPWWNPAVEDQATDRAHRIGQQKPVTVYRLVAKGTIEEKILEMHANKRELVASVLDGTDKAGRMTTDDMIDLIKEGAFV
ncbi:MAG: DEAD/DEAH box helicase, partial [Planctomycetota bacterium]